MTSRIVHVDGDGLTVGAVCRVAHGQAEARLGKGVSRRLAASRRVVERVLREDRPAYGINTGYGQLARVRIASDRLSELQLNLIRSHAAGVGPHADAPTVRALLLLRANVLARGHSGVRAVVVRRLLDLLAADLLPVVPEMGSVGASGDLAPLAHVALTLIGEGECSLDGKRLRSRRALGKAGLEPLTLEPKEALALINGTQFSAAIACLALARAENLVRTADVVAALTIDGLRGTWRAFDPRVHEARPHPGQRVAADNLYRLLQRSDIWKSHESCSAVQDAYSLRCAPQVHGATRDALTNLERVLAIEINASTDNPMVFANEGDIISGGNFHGAPLAAATDYAGAALVMLGTIVERRVDRLVNPLISGLPPFLARDAGLESGLMMAHVTAAAVASECKTLAHPASVDTIPTSGNQEDHVSMSPWSARKLLQIVERVEILCAIELLASVRALRLLRPLQTSPPLEAVVTETESRVRIPDRDATLSPVIESLTEIVREGMVVEAAAAAGTPVR